jgi:hypothetical protein
MSLASDGSTEAVKKKKCVGLLSQGHHGPCLADRSRMCSQHLSNRRNLSVQRINFKLLPRSNKLAESGSTLPSTEKTFSSDLISSVNNLNSNVSRRLARGKMLP